ETLERVAESRKIDSRPGIEARRQPQVFHRRIPVPEALLGTRRCRKKIGVAGRNALRLRVLLQRAVEVFGNQPFVASGGQVSLQAVGCERDGLLRRLPGTLRERGRRRACEIQDRAGPTDPCPRLRKTGIQRDGLLVEAELFPNSGGIITRAVPGLLAFQEG